MLHYWTTWNFLWFVGVKTGYLSFSNAFKSSIITTSIVGGFMTYIYPRKFIFRLRHAIQEIEYETMVWNDIIFHQYPFVSIFLLNQYKVENERCGGEIIFPFICWGLYNKLFNYKFNDLYGVKMYKLIISSFSILSAYGYWHHLIKNK